MNYDQINFRIDNNTLSFYNVIKSGVVERLKPVSINSSTKKGVKLCISKSL